MQTGAASVAPIRWLHDEARAVRQSRSTGKALLIDFRADWCAACKMLDKHTWADPAVQDEVRSRFVPLSLDVSDENAATSRLTKKYGITGLPTVVIMVCKGRSAKTRCIARSEEDHGRLTGYVSPAEMLELLRSFR